MELISYIKRRLSAFRKYRQTVAVSTDYRPIEIGQTESVAEVLRDSWKNAQLPERQRAIVEPQLEIYRAGGEVRVFDALVEILKNNIPLDSHIRLLEIGCSSGYYSEVLRLRQVNVSYVGCDYSPAFIDLAKRLHPNVPFDVQDATKLRYGDASFQVVVSGGCILHIPEYEKAISEAVRVASRWVVFHRTPVVHLSGPLIFTKKAYGVDTIEIHFNEQQLIQLFARYGLRTVDINTNSISCNPDAGDALAMKTYLCERTSNA